MAEGHVVAVLDTIPQNHPLPFQPWSPRGPQDAHLRSHCWEMGAQPARGQHWGCRQEVLHSLPGAPVIWGYLWVIPWVWGGGSPSSKGQDLL